MISQFSQRGNYHKSREEVNQDCVMSEETSRHKLIVLADGATGCRFGAEGARAACTAAIKWLTNGCENMYFDAEKLAFLLLEEVAFHQKKEAQKLNSQENETASTLALACLDKEKNKILLFNVGDGALFVKRRSDEKYRLELTPKKWKGNAILTVHQCAYKLASVEVVDAADISSVFICSDGADANADNGRVEKIIDSPESFVLEDDMSFIRLDL